MEVFKYKDKGDKDEKVDRIAAPIDTLYHEINALEVQMPGKPENVIAHIKGMIMTHLGLIEVTEEPKKPEEEEDAQPENEDLPAAE